MVFFSVTAAFVLLCHGADVSVESGGKASVAREPAPPPRNGTQFRALHPGGVYEAPRFLSDGEVEHLLRLLEASGGWGASPTGGAAYGLPSDGAAYRAMMCRDPVAARIERRIAEATGIASHADEDNMSIARIRSRGASHFPPFGLHHDSDGRPYRSRTVIMYLTTVPEGEGGMTIFPLLYAPKGAATARRHAEFAAAISTHYTGRSKRWQRHVTFDPAAKHPFNTLLSAACRGRHGVAVRPRRGAAIMFEQRRAVDGEENDATWHAGCNLVTTTSSTSSSSGGTEKVILQKFKELPLGERPERDRQIPFPYKSCERESASEGSNPGIKIN